MYRRFLVGLTLFVAGCGSPLELSTEALPEWGDFELPPSDESLDPEDLAVGEIIATACAFGKLGDALEPLRAHDEWVVVDVYFGRNTPDGPWQGPRDDDKAWVTSHGGRVLYDFAVPAVRARIIMSAIPDMVAAMVRESKWPVIRTVPDLRRYDVKLSIGLGVPLTDDHITFFESLGGRVVHRFEYIDALSGVMPDRSIPTLRDRWNPVYVEASGVLCLT